MSSGNFLEKKPAFRTLRAPLVALGSAALLLVAVIPISAAQTSTALPPLGMSVGSIAGLISAGAPPRYASYWVGDWMATSGWGGFDNAMKTAKAAGVTPVIYWYYWGDSISPYCFDADGCNGRNEAEWNALTDQLVSHIKSQLAGAEALVVLENEFNKGGITGDYAPIFDAKLERIALKLKTAPGVKLIVGFGNWGEANWAKFPKTIAQSQFVGFQMMRASTKDTETSYRAAADRAAYLTNYIAEKFNKPSLLYDLALSSYPDDHWRIVQAETLDAIFDKLIASGSTGLQGVVYRSLDDHAMDPANYYGLAESHWGLRTKDGVAKPAFDVWLAHAKGSAAAPAPTPEPTPTPTPDPASSNVPGSFEAESMTATKGGKRTDSLASGGAAWNLWANGQLSTTLVSNASRRIDIAVSAYGQAAGGISPKMEVRLGGVTIASYTVPPGSYQTYKATADLPAGSTTLAIAYTNDAIVGTEDRNLIVDVVRVSDAPAPAPAPEPAPAPNRAPVASFASSVSDLRAIFDASASSDPDGDALVFEWSFGDGASATGSPVSHDYSGGGSYTTTLVVNDSKTATSTSRSITAIQPNRAPVASATAAGANDTYSFDASASSDPDGDTLAYAWSFGDGSSVSCDPDGCRDQNGASVAGATASGAKATHTYGAAGAYTASVTVTDARGLASRASVGVTSVKPAFDATFSDIKGNNYWVETDVDANQPLATVCAMVNGGTCKALSLRSYGWAASFYVPTGADVVFRATSEKGETKTSGAYDWPSATPVASAPAPAPSVTFAPYDGNSNWVQTKISTTASVKSVCASLNGGGCKPLTLRSWGAWAASMDAPSGTKVVFQATLGDGTLAKSATYLWPVK